MDDYLNSIDGVLAQHTDPFRQGMANSRPTAKSIYEQRKQYAQSLTKNENTFQHRVEHLLTCDLDNEIRSVEDCMRRLRSLDAEGRIWGQDVMLEVKNGQLQLNDLETRDNLEAFSLQNVQSCQSVMGRPTYNSVLAVTIQEYQKPSVYLFQCDDNPANVLHANLDKAMQTSTGDQESTYLSTASLSRNSVNSAGPTGAAFKSSIMKSKQLPRTTFIPSPPASNGWESPQLNQRARDSPRDSPMQPRKYVPDYDQSSNVSFQSLPQNNKSGMERDIEVLNHVLQDVEAFFGKLNTKNKKKGKSAIPEAQFIDCLQKIKYSFNLLGKVQDHMQQPTASDLVHTLFSIIPTVLSKCPRKNVAPTVVSPLLTQKALILLSESVYDKERQLWDTLGDAWKRTRADWPNGKSVPQYVPVFSDGWIPPEIPMNSEQPQTQKAAQTPPSNRHFQPVMMRVLFDFDARNSRELSVRKGDNVKVLDQSRQWWLVEDSLQQKGFIPNNILDTGEDVPM
uniref:EPS8 signaling adaptor L3 n=1 Tax=Leptobrachium leishanense TaxID=445787 RepID=A0A8C5LZ01_9ANUR